MDTAPGHSNPFGDLPVEAKRAAVVAENVRRLRTKAKINKKTFALMVGIGRPLLNKIENGEANPRLSLLEKLADALETTPEYLLVQHEDAMEATPTRTAGLSSEVRHIRLIQ